MAYVETKHCDHCNTDKPHTNGKCTDCMGREAALRRLAWYSMSVHEKVQYLHNRLELLEELVKTKLP